jgi:multidrug transporter EmrE-like cation transporter
MQRLLEPFLYFVYAAASVSGLILIKASIPNAKALFLDQRTFLNVPVLLIILGGMLYVASFSVWMIILSRNDLSTAYPIAVGITIVMTMVGAGTILSESLTLGRIVGSMVVFFGIWILTKAS